METKCVQVAELFIKLHYSFVVYDKSPAANREAMNKIETGIAKYPA